MPSIGKMKQRISLYDHSVVEADNYSVKHNDSFISTVWAQVINIVGTERVDGRESSEVATHQFNIRFRADVSKQTVIVYEGIIYEIVTTSVMGDDRNRFMSIDAKMIESEVPVEELVITVSETRTDVDGDLYFDMMHGIYPSYEEDGVAGLEFSKSSLLWRLGSDESNEDWTNPSTEIRPPKTGWSIGSLGSPRPVLDY